jgi:hypothetical protein
MEQRVRTLALLSILLWPACLWAEYTTTELLTIGWGIEPNQLDFSRGGPVGPPGSFEEPTAGPSRAIVDMEENIIVCSFQLFQLKGFTNTGELIFDFSTDGAGFNPEMYYETPENIYVDSSMRLYIQSDPGTRYVPVIEYSGETIGSCTCKRICSGQDRN